MYHITLTEDQLSSLRILVSHKAYDCVTADETCFYDTLYDLLVEAQDQDPDYSDFDLAVSASEEVIY